MRKSLAKVVRAPAARAPGQLGVCLDTAGTLPDSLHRDSARRMPRRLPRRAHEPADDEHLNACRALLADVRAAGSWKAYARAPPKALLRLRSLVARGRARSVKRLRARTPREIELLFAPAFPNELCWRVLEYWNPRA